MQRTGGFIDRASSVPGLLSDWPDCTRSEQREAPRGTALPTVAAVAAVRREARTGFAAPTPVAVAVPAVASSWSCWPTPCTPTPVSVRGPEVGVLQLAPVRLFERRLAAAAAATGACCSCETLAAAPRAAADRWERLGAVEGCRSGSCSSLAVGSLACTSQGATHNQEFTYSWTQSTIPPLIAGRRHV